MHHDSCDANCSILVFTAEQIYDKYIYKGEDVYA